MFTVQALFVHCLKVKSLYCILLENVLHSDIHRIFVHLMNLLSSPNFGLNLGQITADQDFD